MASNPVNHIFSADHAFAEALNLSDQPFFNGREKEEKGGGGEGTPASVIVIIIIIILSMLRDIFAPVASAMGREKTT